MSIFTLALNIRQKLKSKPLCFQPIVLYTQGSLVPDTLKEMEADDQFQATLKDLKTKGQIKMTREERKKRQRALTKLGTPRFLAHWRKERETAGLAGITFLDQTTLDKTYLQHTMTISIVTHLKLLAYCCRNRAFIEQICDRYNGLEHRNLL